MHVRMDYGKTGMEVEVPDQNLLGVLGITPAPPITDSVGAISAALGSPIGTKPLATLARGKQTVCIVICDITRPVPNETILTPMLEILETAGVPRDGITILIATGTHRPNLGEELIALVGAKIANEYRCVNHECKDASMMTDLGVSPNGVPVRLNRIYVEAELKLSVGLIEPHFMAGYSGGRKLIMPGSPPSRRFRRGIAPGFSNTRRRSWVFWRATRFMPKISPSRKWCRKTLSVT